ncbi:hypothetical protein [Pseudonocardia acaciae]|uniref:hypothetical protein n=1 Tax=Pseudonocardia acaciae TaxID=551276 RepID=UPI00048D8C1D|nr:hypothetical protein [Pseudonocardia acaciae]
MPEPILTAIATALAGKAAAGLYQLVKDRFAERRAAREALEAATQAPDDPAAVAVLADRLAEAERDDPEFREALRSGWAELASGGVVNQVHSSVTGKLVQARDIHGNITL